MKTFRPKNYLAEWSIPEMKFEEDAALQVGCFFPAVNWIAGVGTYSYQAKASGI